MLNSVEEAKEKTKNHAADFIRKISLQLRRASVIYLPRFARFHAAYPAIKLSILAKSRRCNLDGPSGDADLAMVLSLHSFVDLKAIPLITPKLTLIIPRRGVRFTFRQIGLKELSQQPMVLLQPVTTTRAVIAEHSGKTISRCALKWKPALASKSSAMSPVRSGSALFMTSVLNRRTTADFEP